MAGTRSAPIKYSSGRLRADTRQLDKKIADFVDQALSDRLDLAFGTTRGTVIYRGENAWAALAPGTSGQFLKTLGDDADPAWASVDVSGRLIAGTPLVMNPIATSTTVTQAHGLGAVPVHVEFEMECLSDNLGYTAGQIARGGMGNYFTYEADGTNTRITVGGFAPAIINKATFATAAVTLANWKLTITPYARSV